jgi:large subunit ribosomal protein L18
VDLQKLKAKGRVRRKKRVRKKVFGSAERPRLSVYRSHCHIYGQVIDDMAGRTLAAASSLSKELRRQLKKGGGDRAAAGLVGKLLGEKAKAADIKKVVFDRNGFRYHGRVKEFAEAARKAGLEF